MITWAYDKMNIKLCSIIRENVDLAQMGNKVFPITMALPDFCYGLNLHHLVSLKKQTTFTSDMMLSTKTVINFDNPKELYISYLNTILDEDDFVRMMYKIERRLVIFL